LVYGYRNPQVFLACFFLTEIVDPQGRKLVLEYASDNYSYVHIDTVTEPDGPCTTLYHEDVSHRNLVTSVSGPSGTVSLSYDETGQNLTGIQDAMGMSTTFSYDANYWPTAMVTPAGTTGFTLYDAGGDINYAGVGRYAIISEPGGTAQVFSMFYIEPGIQGFPTTYSSSVIPQNTPLNTLDSGGRNSRSSFHWNRQQTQALSTADPLQFTWADYLKGRHRRWLDGHMSTLSTEQSPSPDGSTEGQITWFDHMGKATASAEGNQILPAVIARVMPDGSTWYAWLRRNSWGHLTNVVEKWDSGGTALYRTNIYVRAADEIDLVAHTNAMGVLASSNVFNAYHQVTTNYNALGEPTVFTYGSTRQLTSITRPTGLVTTNIYASNNRLQKTIDLQINRTNSFTWYSSGNLESHTSERGLSVTNYWDALNRLTGTKYPDGTTTTNLYTIGSTKVLDLTATKDRLGWWTYFGYDGLRRMTAETNANGVVTRYGYCDCGDGVTATTNAWNTATEFVTQFSYDYQGNRTYVVYPDATITNWYDPLGRLTKTADAWGYRLFHYDNLTRLTNVANAYGSELTAEFDVEDNPLYVTDANGVSVTNIYDVLDRLSTRTYPDGGVERFGYSSRGLVAYTNQLNKITYYGYDEAMRKTWETNANSEIIRYTNNAAGDLLSLTDGKNQTTKWNYDEYGRVTNKLDQVGAEILRYKYDPDSQLTNRWSTAKGNTYYSYDPIGNLTNINYPASTDVKFQYDPLNRVTNMVDAAGTTKYAYAAGGQLWTEDGPFSNDTVTNSYNNRLRTALSLAQPTGKWTNSFGYDPAKRLTNVTSQAGSFAYLLPDTRPSTLVTRLSLPNTSYITNTYDSVARLTGTWLKKNDGTTLNSHEYTHNPGNQRTQQVFNAGSTYSYTYDAIGQLTFGDSATAAEDRRYVYDAAWNLNYRTNNTTTYTFKVDTKNQLTNATPVGNQTYDGNGNVTSSESGSRTFSYDDENRLTTNELAYTTRSVFTYDGLGRLRQRQEFAWAGTPYFYWYVTDTVRYVYDGMRVIQERSDGNTPTVSYTRGSDLSGSLEGSGGIGGLLARSHGYSSGNWSTHNCYHADGNGNVTYLVNSSQTLAASYRYDPYGNTISSSGGLASANVYRFSSKELHVNSGLYYYGYRWYHPNLQRWLNKDPIGERGGMNLYGYADNSPIVFTDASGLWVISISVGRGGFGVGLRLSGSGNSVNGAGFFLGGGLGVSAVADPQKDAWKPINPNTGDKQPPGTTALSSQAVFEVGAMGNNVGANIACKLGAKVDLQNHV
jgi:RHS repeat-associated protein